MYPDDISSSGLYTPVDNTTCPSVYDFAVETKPAKNSLSVSTRNTVSPIV